MDLKQLSQQECLAELLSVFGNEAPHQWTISRWYGEFKRGPSDESRVGAPNTAATQEDVDAVRKLIIEDEHVTYGEIEASLKILKTSIQKILHEELGVRKLVSRWIPHLLTEEQKAARVNWCQETLERFNAGNSKMFITELRKINPERRIILHQDNASSHITQKTRQYLTEENVELLDHSAYSPDLSPNDFFTFPKIKNKLRGQRFQSPEEVVDTFNNAVLDLPANEWNKCFENWFEHFLPRIEFCQNGAFNFHNMHHWSDENPKVQFKENMCFQHDDAPAHFGRNVRNWLNVNFPDSGSDGSIFGDASGRPVRC
ncbi:unnamed protein product [Acanthoscelides obtectus]|uniref:Transposase n=1 Tax=Acanthoscelides obtectus TaxID=200917 RepID=A0A9P0JTK6_ACAOB|nr:unnamed protein product [Acanthoscelides obtectus]CAK1668467.1 Histone-lysine N-methyltransferase SETMAR [Acanthoscelides obtectus]